MWTMIVQIIYLVLKMVAPGVAKAWANKNANDKSFTEWLEKTEMQSGEIANHNDEMNDSIEGLPENLDSEEDLRD